MRFPPPAEAGGSQRIIHMKDLAQPKSGSRLAYLDNIRIFLTALVIAHHASIAFGGGGDWEVSDPVRNEITSILLTYFTAVNQSYFMSAFFLLAGYFTPRSLEKKGPSTYLVDRLIRLGIPLLVYTTLIININRYLVQVVWLNQPFSWVWEYNPGHLWFLQGLLVFAVIYVVYRIFSDRDPDHKRFQYFSDRFPPNRALIVSIAVLAILTFAVRIFIPIGEWIGGIQPAHFVHYIFCFFVGILAYRGDWFSRLKGSQAKPWGIVALVMLPVFFVIAILGGALEGEEQVAKLMGGAYWQNLAYCIWESIMLIAVLTFILYFFRERITQAGRLERALAASVYTVYIIHQTIVIAIDIFFVPLSMPPALKFISVAIIAVPLCFGLGMLILKIPGTKRVLG
jgi:glucans biosynthesis protein C